MYFLSFLGGSCGHIRYSLCMVKYPFGEGDGYIYKKNKPGGCHAPLQTTFCSRSRQTLFGSEPVGLNCVCVRGNSVYL